MGTLNNRTHQDYGDMLLAQCGSTYVWTVLILSILEEKIFIIYTRLMSLTQNIPVVIQPSDRARGALFDPSNPVTGPEGRESYPVTVLCLSW
jgi:hypothetical protein